MTRTRLSLNEDCNHFAYTRTADEMTPEGVDALVDAYADGTHVSELVFNVNAMRSAIPSAVKQPFWEGFDPQGGPGQAMFRTEESREVMHHWVSNMLLLQRRGIDLYQRWIDRSRHHGVSPWISVRMNDIHNVNDPDSIMHDRLWREHPEYWRVTWREFESAHDRALDYGQAAVREHHLAYIRECVSRYDMDGLELDFSRAPWCFRAGEEEEGGRQLNVMLRDIHRALDERAAQVGHPIRLSARVPSHPETSRRMGFDVGAWAADGLVSKVVPTPEFGTNEFDIPIELWKQLVRGTGTAVAPGMENFFTPHPFAAFQYLTPEMVRGAVASYLDRGADGIYLYNYMDRDPGWRGGFDEILREAGSMETISGKPRRHLLTFANTWPPGQPPVLPLPHRLSRYGYRPTAEFRVPSGPAPRAGERIEVRLGLHAGDQPEDVGRVIQAYGRKVHVDLPVAPADVARQLQVRVAGAPCEFAGAAPPDIGWSAERPGPTYVYRAQNLRRGDNLIEVRNPTETTLTVLWAEIAVLP